ncbi:GGDEF domain-containing protein [Nocardioides sp. TF02-7]|uniref:GGDEF domain-containing protein n=1 Tax=Nocardioides sp. TF02-7 TaxID=2917724 RepID=UPI001F06CF7F|nr:GGDEF domain-containing protein [Nocardioides sp. TF02-7]UMG91902.1 GGDEF domain-containing protein [Nocardioides sp. TF02-7]
MDTATLRVAFGLVALCVLVLFYGATYRTTKAPYCGWWCSSMALFIVSSLLYLLNGTPAQAVANPLGNTLAVAGGSAVWAAARSLRGRRTPYLPLLLPAAVVLVASALAHPERDVWAGGAAFLAGMALAFGLTSHELAGVLREHRPGRDEWAQHRFTIGSLLAASTVVAVFYLLRCVVFVAVGPDHELFRTAFGSELTTLLTMALLVVVTFSMSALSHLQQTSELREQATHDGLTGALNRSAFMRAAERSFADDAVAASGVVMVADLDGFKALNDGHGHAAGDRALVAFARVCLDVVGDGGTVGRLGGDEFAVLLRDGSQGERVAREISNRFGAEHLDETHPTVSFGIAAVDASLGVKDTIVRADVALYQAKAAGRDRVERYVVPAR